MTCNRCQKKDCLNCKNSQEKYKRLAVLEYNDNIITQESIKDQYENEISKLDARLDGEEESQQSSFGLDGDLEDKLRIFISKITQLKPLEILMIHSILKGRTLTEFAKDIEDLCKRNQTCTRFHAFQIRKSLCNKIPELKHALLTAGQRKGLK